MTDEQPSVRTFRAWGGIVGVALGAALVLFLLGDAVAKGGWGQMLLLAPWPLLILWGLYVLTAASTLRIDDAGAVVQNMLRRTSFGWRRLREADFRWQLEFLLDDGRRVTAMAGPARSRARRRVGPDGEDRSAAVPNGVRILGEIQDRQDAAGADAEAPIRRTWDWVALGALLVLVLWAFAAVMITR
ncbi:PH domain-containing protein [Microbacterium bovistercoris]|uniref:PH domain-containing protein n=1 Tax=Microbacterium bovistercoris TaxID=2293570 RepID=A0A371NWW9_9MICO|nr:PH domain-containing protein [Microbacterium bovistercoris]REJ07651.1 PH domain-containing protein [Microbacterium bovistercoris]